MQHAVGNQDDSGPPAQARLQGLKDGVIEPGGRLVDRGRFWIGWCRQACSQFRDSGFNQVADGSRTVSNPDRVITNAYDVGESRTKEMRAERASGKAICACFSLRGSGWLGSLYSGLVAWTVAVQDRSCCWASSNSRRAAGERLRSISEAAREMRGNVRSLSAYAARRRAFAGGAPDSARTSRNDRERLRSESSKARSG